MIGFRPFVDPLEHVIRLLSDPLFDEMRAQENEEQARLNEGF